VVEMRDDESQQWAAFFDAWQREYGDAPVSVADVAARLCNCQTTLQAAIPDALLVMRDRGVGSLRRSLGRHLAKRAGRVINGRKLVFAGEHSSSHHKMWRLQPVNGEVCEVNEFAKDNKFTLNFTP